MLRDSILRSRSGLLPLCFSILPALALGCGGPTDPAPEDPPEVPSLGGVYRVEGTTVEIESGNTREIRGLVVLEQDGDTYFTSFDLSTGFPEPGDDATISVDVIGEGIGEIGADATLEGTAETQLIRAAVPGVDASFAFLPRVVGARIQSTTSARLRGDGLLSVEIESHPAEGQRYASTRTTLIGKRVGDVGRAPPLPGVSSGPPEDEEAVARSR